MNMESVLSRLTLFNHSLVPPQNVFFAASVKHRLLVQAPPKGGATLAIQLIIRADGLEAAASAHVGRKGASLSDLGELVHGYHSSVVMRHRKAGSCARCSDEAWSCIKLVRSPFDRVVSSYLRTAADPTGSHLPKMRADGSFSDFVHALEARAMLSASKQQPLANRRKSDHYLPQLRLECDLLRRRDSAQGGSVTNVRMTRTLGAEDAALPLIPIECFDAALRQLRSERPAAAYQRLDVRNLSATSHYRAKMDASAEYGSRLDPVWTWKYSTHFSAHRAVPTYSSFLNDTRLRELVARLFSDDLELYEAACRQRWLQATEECIEPCAAVFRHV